MICVNCAIGRLLSLEPRAVQALVGGASGEAAEVPGEIRFDKCLVTGQIEPSITAPVKTNWRAPCHSSELTLGLRPRKQDAGRARKDLEAFCRERGLTIAATYEENESGASLHRPELFRLLSDSKPGDILLTEQVDRLSLLSDKDWEQLKREIKDREVKVVALDLPTSQMMLKTEDAFTGRMFDAINGMLLDMLAAIARKDYDDRRRRQAQGIAKAKAEGRMKGRPEDAQRSEAILEMLKKGQSWNTIVRATNQCRDAFSLSRSFGLL